MASKAELRNFFVYNPEYGPREETEHEKLLYFHPQDVQLDTKMNCIGLSEAIVKYTSTFSPEHPCESMHTQKTRQVFYNPEPDFWFSTTVFLPYTQKVNKDGKSVFEYHQDKVQDSVLIALLTQAYKMYRLFNGPMADLVDELGKEALCDRLDRFFSTYLQTIDFASADLLLSFNGIQFLPLDKNTYLQIQCFINQTEATFPNVKHTVFLFNDHLVWSGLEQEDMRVLYRYLTGGLLQASTGETTMSKTKRKGFITGPENISDPETPVNAPRVFVTTMKDGKALTEALHLIIFQCHSITYCFLIEPDSLMDTAFYQRLHDFAGAKLVELETLVSEQVSKRVASAVDQYRYLYFNHMNLASKSSFLPVEPRLLAQGDIAGPPQSVPTELVRYLTSIHADFQHADDDSEIVLKTHGDVWIVGIKSEQRELFVVFLNQKNADLVEISEEIRRLSLHHFNNIFFID